MPDTDDDQFIELDPVQREQGDDDTEAASERRAAKARAEAARHPTHDLEDAEAEAERQDDEDARLREEREDAHDRADFELTAKEDRELLEQRHRDGLIEATRAREIAFADDAAATAQQYRTLAATGRQRELGLQARGQHKQDEAAVSDGPGAAELGAEGRRNIRASELEGYQANADYDRAAAYEDLAAEHRATARQPQPDAIEAVRKRPQGAPEAQTPQESLHRRDVPQPSKRKKSQSQRPDNGFKLDLDM